MSVLDAAKRVFDTVRLSGFRWTASLALDRAGVGTMGLWAERTVGADTLRSQIEAILRAWGMAEDHVAITTRHMLYADRRGIESHGCGMMLKYHRDRAAGTLTMTPRIVVAREGAATALVDGGGGLGHVPADTAMKMAIAKGRATGIASVAVRNSGHFGAAGAYAEMAAREGLIGIATTSVARPALVPTHGIEAALGTNPIAFAAPAARNRPFLLDMATSAAPVGKLMTAWRKGSAIPPGWALDARGKPETNPRRAADSRRLTPLGSTPEMGSHKGYGLAALVEILSSVLSGTRRAREAPSFASADVGHFFLALDPRRFRDEGEFEADLDGMMDGLRAVKPLDPNRSVLVPGDPEYAAEAERERRGIPLPRAVVEDIRTVCHEASAPFLLDAGA